MSDTTQLSGGTNPDVSTDDTVETGTAPADTGTDQGGSPRDDGGTKQPKHAKLLSQRNTARSERDSAQEKIRAYEAQYGPLEDSTPGNENMKDYVDAKMSKDKLDRLNEIQRAEFARKNPNADLHAVDEIVESHKVPYEVAQEIVLGRQAKESMKPRNKTVIDGRVVSDDPNSITMQEFSQLSGQAFKAMDKKIKAGTVKVIY